MVVGKRRSFRLTLQDQPWGLAELWSIVYKLIDMAIRYRD
jgi:hypothetical protein